MKFQIEISIPARQRSSLLGLPMVLLAVAAGVGADCGGPTDEQVLDFHLVPDTTDYAEQWLLDQPIGQFSQNLELRDRTSLTLALVRGPRDGEMIGTQPVTATVFLEELNGRGLQSFLVNAEPREVLVPPGTYRLVAHPSTNQEAGFLEPYREEAFEVPEVGMVETLEFVTGSAIRGRVRIDDPDQSSLGDIKVSAVPVFENTNRTSGTRATAFSKNCSPPPWSSRRSVRQ